MMPRDPAKPVNLNKFEFEERLRRESMLRERWSGEEDEIGTHAEGGGMSGEIWTPGKQQQAQIGVQIADSPGASMLVISDGVMTVQLQAPSLEAIEAIGNLIVALAE